MSEFDKGKSYEAYINHSWPNNETIGPQDIWHAAARWQHSQDQATIEELTSTLKTAVKYLKEGKLKFAPNTTNSFVDDFIRDNDK